MSSLALVSLTTHDGDAFRLADRQLAKALDHRTASALKTQGSN
jgi:hypothetical protein